MTVAATTATPASSPGGLLNALGRRRLYHYPRTGPRFAYLGLVTIVSIISYYLYFEQGTVTPKLLPYYHMSFLFLIYLMVVSNALGAFTAWIGGLADQIGRANLTIYGMLGLSLEQLGIAHMHTKPGFVMLSCVGGFIEGIILVSTPALMRDFSPQMGRATAMGFWALGPLAGSLVGSLVATRTLGHLHPWQDQYVISGLACMGMVVIAFLFLRELSPPLRDQLMVTERERALVEARAMGIDVKKAMEHPMRSVMRPELIASALGVSLNLLIFYTTVSVMTIYWVVVFGRSTTDANGINVWAWAFDSGALVLAGLISDRLRVRKPFMALGAAVGIVMMILFILQVDHPHTGYYSNVLLAVLLGVAIDFSYTPWMAHYTERVEAHNPALVATGLALWGWILRIVVALAFLVLPRVITTATTLVDNQGASNTLEAMQAAAPYYTACASRPAPASVIAGLQTTGESGPQTLAKIITSCNQSHNLLAAVSAAGGLSSPQVQGLLAFDPLATAIEKGQPVSNSEIATEVGIHSHDLANLLVAEKKLVPAQKASPNEWKRWWWVCLAGTAVFFVIVFAMPGRWSPRAAKRDFEEHERWLTDELAKIRREMAPAGTGDIPEPAPG
jgi:MFS family permease